MPLPAEGVQQLARVSDVAVALICLGATFIRQVTLI